MYAYLMRLPNLHLLFIFETKCNTKSISVSIKINLVEMYEDIYKGKKVPFPCVMLVSPIVVNFRTFAPDRDFFTLPTLFTGVILVYNS